MKNSAAPSTNHDQIEITVRAGFERSRRTTASSVESDHAHGAAVETVVPTYSRCMPDESSENHEEPVAVAVHPDRGEAEVTVAHLAANGIDAVIVDQVEGGTVPIEGEWGVAVVVKAVDAPLAREVLQGDGDVVGDIEGELEGDLEA
jgi:hypothetical protein